MEFVQTYEQFMNNINEGVHDPSIFKAIFLAGGPGSGKSFVVNKVTSGLGYRVVNVDDIYELKLKKAGLSTNPEDIFSTRGQEIRDDSQKLTNKLASNYISGRLGLIIDGTGKDFNKIKNQSDALRNLGYETYMIFVNTSLDIALKRNEKRSRTLKPSLVEKMWREVQDNIGKFQNYFGSNNFTIIDNNSAKENIFNKVWKKVMLFSRKPVRNKIAKNWIKNNI